MAETLGYPGLFGMGTLISLVTIALLAKARRE
jgi:hypothetical protein